MGRWALVSLAVLLAWGTAALPAGALMSSPRYRLDADVLNYGGGEGSSPLYRAFDSLGDFTSGLSYSANYATNDGFGAQVNTIITLVLDASTKSLGTLTPGTPVEATTTLSITTDAANGYSLAARYSGTMASGPNTIADFNGSIATPATWTSNCLADSNQCGFGFTVSEGTAVDEKWGTGTKYAAFTTTATEIHRKYSFSSGADTTKVRYRSDVNNTQVTGDYQTTVTYTATATL